MTAFLTRESTHLGVDRIFTSVTATALYENLLAAFQGDATAVAAGLQIVTAAIANSAVTTAKIADSNVTAAKLAPDSIVEAAIVNSSVSQAKIKTTTGEVSTTAGSPGTNLVLPGGSYGFWIQAKSGSALVLCTVSGGATTSTSYVTFVTLTSGDGATTVYAQQRFIQASPPYDIGDGEVPLFVFVLVDSLGKVLATWVSEDPPWANNGPADIRADFTDKQGRTWQRRRPRLNRAAFLNPATRTAEITRLAGAPELVEVTQAVKQTDMPLIPHPFLGNDLTGKTVVLLDPVGAISEELRGLHLSGESISDLLHGGYLTLGNTPLARSGPPGCMPVAVNWK